ncbi:hypothetical protein B9G69_015140 [Bdellovibrio sp. SKB1291214]|uniref:hypothetical protein n=1 Tax=Bdellovibrio sp. SKB1291214 TaxID=1732569 RepID=UPI000B517C97|nr:hypothetical protein [Bdellovibrio sp. SKB1291214]UYL08376.1 hypothetical protein B9G69_015140 [Bdellovibrio sp. SKB1291214]
MKTLLSTFAIILSLASFAEAKSLSCRSVDIIEGWTGFTTRDHVTFTAVIQSDELLAGARMRGALIASAGALVADQSYASKNPRYVHYTRFSGLEDAWCWYTPFLPKDMANTTNSEFTGFMGRTCENGSTANIALKCVIK